MTTSLRGTNQSDLVTGPPFGSESAGSSTTSFKLEMESDVEWVETISCGVGDSWASDSGSGSPPPGEEEEEEEECD